MLQCRPISVCFPPVITELMFLVREQGDYDKQWFVCVSRFLCFSCGATRLSVIKWPTFNKFVFDSTLCQKPLCKLSALIFTFSTAVVCFFCQFFWTKTFDICYFVWSVIYLRVELEFAHDKLRNGATYCSKILHTALCRACVTHGLGLMSNCR